MVSVYLLNYKLVLLLMMDIDDWLDFVLFLIIFVFYLQSIYIFFYAKYH